MYNLSDLPNKVTYCNCRIRMVFNGTENYKLSHNHNIVNFISNRLVGDHWNAFQSPRASGRLLNAHPVLYYNLSIAFAWLKGLATVSLILQVLSMVVKPLLKGCNRLCIYHICWVVIPVIDHSYDNAVWLAPDLTLGLLFVDFKSVASGDLRWQEFEEDSWIDSVKSYDFVGLDMSPLFLLYWSDGNLSRRSRSSYEISSKPGTSRVALCWTLSILCFSPL